MNMDHCLHGRGLISDRSEHLENRQTGLQRNHEVGFNLESANWKLETQIHRLFELQIRKFRSKFVQIPVMTKLLVSCLIFLAAANAIAAEPPEPLREFRAAWVASVWNIDWPSSPNVSAKAQRAELTQILDMAAELKMNAIILQVRPESDALYASEIEPWSYWLTAKQGRPPGDGVDPLKLAVQQAHERGIELHAWFNPFRAVANKSVARAANHVSKAHPDWILPGTGGTWLNPALAEVQDRAIAVMTDVAKRYDVDGIHIDDYFYPYPKKVDGKNIPQFNDSKSYAAYREDGGKLEAVDWRKDHVNRFVQRLNTGIKKTKPQLKFGISPFGIWKPGHPSTIEAGIDPPIDMAADSREWLRQGWVDYLSPQLYWRIKPAKQSFLTLTEWWTEQNTQNRHLWPGMASSRIKSSTDKTRPAQEMIDQIEITREKGAGGHIHWSFEAIAKNRDGLRGKLTSKVYQDRALIPVSPWLASGPAPKAPTSVEREGSSLSWETNTDPSWWAIQVKVGKIWKLARVLPGSARKVEIETNADDFAVRAVDAVGRISKP